MKRTYLGLRQRDRQPAAGHLLRLLALALGGRRRRLRGDAVLRALHPGADRRGDRLPQHPDEERRTRCRRPPSWARRSRTAASGSGRPTRSRCGTSRRSAPRSSSSPERSATSHSAVRTGSTSRGLRRRRRRLRDCPAGRSAPSVSVAAALRTVLVARPRPAGRLRVRDLERARGCAASPAARRAAAVALAGLRLHAGLGSTMRPLVPGGDAQVVEEVLGGGVGLLRLVERQVQRLVDHLPAVRGRPSRRR